MPPIMGLGAQIIDWDDDLLPTVCRLLRVPRNPRRFDNCGGDIGKSSKLTGGKRLTSTSNCSRCDHSKFRQSPPKPYKIRDMAEDVIGLMDALHVKSAHLVGASMGGMVAQVAISFPQRVRSLTSIMSTTGDPRVPPPSREAGALLAAAPPATRRIFRALRADLEDPARRQLPGG